MEQHVVLVNQKDEVLGTMPKLEAHQKGLLHRAFSIFVLNLQKTEVMLQRRSSLKYHCSGLWTNTCCSHPRLGAVVQEDAQKRLKFEMGLDLLLTPVFNFVYRATFSNGLIEHEFDHVFFARTDQTPSMNLEEADAWQWIPLDVLEKDLEQFPEKYTPWLKLCFSRFQESIKSF